MFGGISTEEVRRLTKVDLLHRSVELEEELRFGSKAVPDTV